MTNKNDHDVGDLVICKYDMDYYIGLSPIISKIPSSFYIGIIIGCENKTLIFFDRDLVYEVLCTDGQRRFFAKWEVEKLSS